MRSSSRRGSRPAYSLPPARPKTPKINSLGQKEFVEFKAPSSTSKITAKLYSIASADDNTYIAMLKSDIYQVQRRLDKALHALGQSASRGAGLKSPGGRPVSARGRDIRAISEATSEVDRIVRGASGASDVKLRLLELLGVKMVQLETAVLRLADSARIFRNVSGTYGAVSMSRVPAYCEIMDQIMSSHRAASRVSMKLDSELGDGPGPLPLALQELEARVVNLCQAVGLDAPEPDSGAFSADRVKAATQALKVMQVRGIQPLKQRAAEAGATVARLRDETEGLHARLEEAHAQLKQSGGGGARAAAGGATSGSGGANLQAALAEIERLRAERGSAADEAAAAADAVRKELGEELSEARAEVRRERAQLAKFKEELAVVKQKLDEAGTATADASSQSAAALAEARAETERVRAEAKALTQRIAVLEANAKALQEAKAAEGAGVVNEGLAKELVAAKEELEARKQSIDGLEMYMRDMAEKKEAETQQHKKAMREQRVKFERERDEWKAEDEIKAKHIESLKAVVDRHRDMQDEEEDDSFEEILREEMRVMKSTFELKISKLKEELAQKSIKCSREVRLVQEKLDSEKRQNGILLSKIRSLERKIAKDADKAAPSYVS